VQFLREVAAGMVGLSDKKETVINHLQKRALGRKKIRKVEFFEEIYNNLLKKYSFILSDSRIEVALEKVKIVDSTTISLLKTS
jgi:phage FluMu gp28-like protein